MSENVGDGDDSGTVGGGGGGLFGPTVDCE